MDADVAHRRRSPGSMPCRLRIWAVLSWGRSPRLRSPEASRCTASLVAPAAMLSKPGPDLMRRTPTSIRAGTDGVEGRNRTLIGFFVAEGGFQVTAMWATASP